MRNMIIIPKITKYYKGVIDSTLREGMQYRFANFSLTQQRIIIDLLIQIGTDFIEVGNPYNRKIMKHIRKLTQIEKRPPILAHIRNRLTDVNAAIAGRVNGVNIFCTVNPKRLAKMHITFADYLETLRSCILSAKEKKLQTRISVENFFQADRNKAFQVYALAEKLGTDRIGIADTLGVAMSWEVEEAILSLRRLYSADIEVHFHNDLGQAVSNALVALRYGANWVDTTLLGVGERNGITALSTLLASLYLFDNSLSDRYRLENLTQAENKVAAMLGFEVPFNLLTNRDNSFAHKAGVHLHAIRHLGASTYEPFSPHIIGNQRQIISGTDISGSSQIGRNNFYGTNNS